MDSKNIITRAASGDREAFRSLVEMHQSDVRGLLLRLCKFNNEAADELAQEVFLLVFKKLSGFQFESSFKSWLYRISYNVFIDEQRKRKNDFESPLEEIFPRRQKKIMPFVMPCK